MPFWLPLFLPVSAPQKSDTHQLRLMDLERRMTEFLAAKRHEASDSVLRQVTRERENLRMRLRQLRGESGSAIAKDHRKDVPALI